MRKVIKRVFVIAVSAIMLANVSISAEGTVILPSVPRDAERHLKTTSGASRISERLSSGYRINRAADDAAGLSIPEKMRNQIRGLEAASRFEADGISFIETSEGSMAEIEEMLKRMRELVTTETGDIADIGDRVKIGVELDELVKELESITERKKISLEELKRMRELVTTETGDIADIGDRVKIGVELDELVKELERITEREKISLEELKPLEELKRMS